MRIAVVPARGGSTRFKDKNIYPLLGKPLVRWSVEAILEADCFDAIVVSTDSDEIYDTVRDLPVIRHQRVRFFDEKDTVLDAMMDALERYYFESDIFAYFLPTCPFTSPDDIIDGVSTFEGEEYDSAVSMVQMDTVQLACSMVGETVSPVFDNLTSGLTNSKFIKKYYKPSGGFYMSRTPHLLTHKNFFVGNVRGIVCDPKNCIDINTIMDAKYAEAVYNE